MAILSPDADSIDGGWTNEFGGTTLYTSLDETTAGDSDYIRSLDNPVGDICEVALSNPTGALTTPFVVRFRFRKEGSDQLDMIVRLMQGATEIVAWTYTDVADTFVDQEETLTSPQLAAITDANDLRLQFEANVPVTVGTSWDPGNIGTHITLSNFDLTATAVGSVDNGTNVRSIANHASGIYYSEFNIGAHTDIGVGVVNDDFVIGSTGGSAWFGGNANCICYFDSGAVYRSAAQVNTLASYADGDVIGMYVDMTSFASTLVGFRVNGGNWNNNVANVPTTGATTLNNSSAAAVYIAFASSFTPGGQVTLNASGTYAFAAPAGAGNW